IAERSAGGDALPPIGRKPVQNAIQSRRHRLRSPERLACNIRGDKMRVNETEWLGTVVGRRSYGKCRFIGATKIIVKNRIEDSVLHVGYEDAQRTNLGLFGFKTAAEKVQRPVSFHRNNDFP